MKNVDILVRPGSNIDYVEAVTRDLIIQNEINKLQPRQKYIIENTVYSNMSLVKAGEKLGICKQRAHQIRNGALKKLAKLLEGKILI